MSTTSIIAKQDKNGLIKAIYCHNDGYLAYNGAILFKYYKDEEKIDKLINLGGLSSLGINPNSPYDDINFGVVDYHRWRNDEIEIINFKSIESLIDSCKKTWIDWLYLYDSSEKCWKAVKIRSSITKNDLVSLRQLLKRENYNLIAI